MRARTPIERAVATYCDDWLRMRVGDPDCARVNPETLANSTPPDFTFRYIDIGSVTEGAVDWRTVERMRFADSPSRARRVVRHGDTLICTVRPLLESHTYAEWTDDEPTVCSTGFAVLRCADGIHPSFLKHLPFAEQVTRQLIAWQCGTSYPAVNERDIRRLVLPVPSSNQQAAIARVLDSVDTAIARWRAALKALKVFRRALSNELLSDGLPVASGRAAKIATSFGTIPSHWLVMPLGDCVKIVRGYAFESSDYVKDGILNFRVSNVGRRANDLGRRQFLPPFFLDRFPAQRLFGGEVVIVMVGATTGKLGRVPEEICPALMNQNMWNLVPKENVTRSFVWHLMPSVVERHMRMAQGSARDFLKQRDLVKILVPVPPLEEQHKIEAVLDGAEELELRHQRKLFLTEQLKGHLMDDLLSGKVHPNLLDLDRITNS